MRRSVPAAAATRAEGGRRSKEQAGEEEGAAAGEAAAAAEDAAAAPPATTPASSSCSKGTTFTNALEATASASGAAARNSKNPRASPGKAARYAVAKSEPESPTAALSAPTAPPRCAPLWLRTAVARAEQSRKAAPLAATKAERQTRAKGALVSPCPSVSTPPFAFDAAGAAADASSLHRDRYPPEEISAPSTITTRGPALLYPFLSKKS